MNRCVLILAAQLVAFWSVWRWYAARLWNSPDEAWGVAALLTAVFCVLMKRDAAEAAEPTERRDFYCAALFTLLFAASYSFVLPLIRACLAMLAVACALGCFLPRRRGGLRLAVTGLLLLALPAIPSLQFFGGYPLRILVARVAAPLLQLGGFAVIAEGTCLNFAGQLIWVDAPCSGVRMLWVGLYLTCTLIAVYEMRLRSALLALVASVLIIIAGNILRAVALFYIEAGIINAPAWTHTGVGVVSFVFVAAGVVALVEGLRRRDTCYAPLSS